MGRYFLYRMHPLSVAECLHTASPGEALLRKPQAIAEEDWRALWEHGVFPNRFCAARKHFPADGDPCARSC